MIRDKRFYLSFFSLMIPLVLQNVIVFGVNLVDNMMLGRYDQLALSAVSVATQVQFVLQMLAMGISEACVVLGAQYWGQQRTGELKSIIGIGVKAQILLSAVFFVLVFFFGAPVAGLITPDTEVIQQAYTYLKILSFSYFFFCMTIILLSAMRCVELVKIGFATTLAALVVNVFLNWVLIFGNLGFPELGLRGAAIATLASRVTEFAVAAVYVLFVDRRLSLRVRELLRLDGSFLGDYMRTGLPIVLSNLLWALATSAQVAILGNMGAHSAEILAANGSIATPVAQIFQVACGAASAAAAVIIGKTVGEGDFQRVREYSRTMQILFLALGVLSGLGIWLSTPLVLRLYSSITPLTYRYAAQFMAVLSVTLVGTTYQVPCLTGIVRGGGDTKFVMYNDLIFQAFVLITSFLAAFVLRLEPVIVYMFLKSDQILKCFVAVVKVNRFRWIRVLTR